MIPVLVGVTLIAFAIVNALPGNTVDAILGSNYTPQAAAALTRELHLNQPMLQRYLEWVNNVIHGNLGTSLVSHESVAKAIWQAVPPTAELVAFSQVLAIVLAVVFATASVLSPTPWVDRAATAVSLFGSSIPAFVTGLLCLILFADHFHLISAIGWQSPTSRGWGANLQAMLTPSLLLALSIFPGYMRVLRQEMYDQLRREEYVTLARMKGVHQTRILTRHVARNSALGIITLIGVSTGFLIGGAVIVEQIFTIPGFGTLMYSAITSSDATMVEGCILIVAVAIVAINLVADLLYAVFDPRIRARS
jgi:peptide/nickel transport system permease protein